MTPEWTVWIKGSYLVHFLLSLITLYYQYLSLYINDSKVQKKSLTCMKKENVNIITVKLPHGSVKSDNPLLRAISLEIIMHCRLRSHV